MADCEARACDRALTGDFDDAEISQLLAAYAAYDQLDVTQRRTREQLLEAFRRLSAAKRNADI